jgi:hypothetical protein
LGQKAIIHTTCVVARKLKQDIKADEQARRIDLDRQQSGNRFFIDLFDLGLDEKTLRDCQIIVTVLT